MTCHEVKPIKLRPINLLTMPVEIDIQIIIQVYYKHSFIAFSTDTTVDRASLETLSI